MKPSQQELKQKERDLKQKMSFFILILMVLSLTVCNTPSRNKASSNIYLTLVNSEHRIPDYWEQRVEFVNGTNSLGEEFLAEKETLRQYEALREELLNEGIQIEAGSVYRSLEDQKEIYEEAKETYGDRVSEYAAEPGYSEHHTGFAVDLFLVKDGTEIRTEEALAKETETFAKIEPHLADHGFVVRVLPGKEEICGGLKAKPWHIRYIGPDSAKEMKEKGIVLEEYLAQ